MPNPLEMGGPPEAPEIQQAPQGNALQSGAPGQPGAAAPQQAPAPNHQQTVAALRHFDAIKDELVALVRNPDLGKSSIKSAIIDATTSLVSKRIISPTSAVQQLGKVPDAPLEQRKWIGTMLQQTLQSERAILAHHAMAFAGGGPEPTPSDDNHMDAMQGVMAHYSGGTK